jgi:hypothetical protein
VGKKKSDRTVSRGSAACLSAVPGEPRKRNEAALHAGLPEASVGQTVRCLWRTARYFDSFPEPLVETGEAPGGFVMTLLRHAIASIHPIVRAVPSELKSAVFDRIFYSPRFNFVYFRVPKAANSTIMLSLASEMNAGALDTKGSAAKKEGKRNLKIPLFSKQRLEKCYKFTFVRNPYSRVLSAYLDKVAIVKPKLRGFLGIDDRDISFLEFLERLDDGYLTANIHWAPQRYIVALPPSQLDFIGRTETLAADLQTVMRQVFGDTDHELVQRTQGVTSASSRVDEMFGEKERRLVRKMYAEDFELFYPDL